MRPLLAGVLIVLSTLLAPLVIGAAWVHARVSDTDAYVRTVEPLAAEPELRERLGEELGVAANAALAEHLPFGLPQTAEDWVADATEQVVTSPGFEEFWSEANREVHAEFLRLVHDENDLDADGWVAVDLGPLLQQVLDRVAGFGLPVALIPEVSLEVPMVRESLLLEHRERYLLAEDVARIGPLVLAALLVGAVAVAPGWRGRLCAAGLGGVGLALAAALTMVAAGPLSELAADRAEQGRSGLTRLISQVVLESLAPYARNWLVVAAPIGAVLLIVGCWPRRRAASR